MVSAAPTTPHRIPFFALLTSYGTVHFSVILAMVSIPWFVLETTGSAARTGLVAAVQGVPMIIAGIFGGVIVDRLGFRRTAFLSDAISGIAFGMIPLLHHTVGITYEQLLLFVFLGAMFDTPGFTARLSMMPDMAKRAGIQLERANSISQTLSQSSILFAPALAGVLIGIIGASAVLWINTGLFFTSAFAVALLIPKPTPAVTPHVHATGRYLGALKQGLGFVIGQKLILSMLLVMMMIQFVRACLMVIMPVYAHDYFGNPSDFGFMFAAMGGGGLISAAFFGLRGHRLPRRPIIVVGVISMSIAFWVLALLPPYWAVLVGLFVMGILTGSMTPLIFTVMQERTPSDLRGRVFGLYDASIFSAMVPGRLLAGFLIEWTGIVSTVLLIGVTYMGAVTLALNNPNMHNLAKPDQSPDSAEPDAEALTYPAGSGEPQEAGR